MRLSAVILLILLPGVFRAQDPVFRTGVSLVRIDAQVTAGAGLIEGLTKDDFVIRDNGQVQPIRYISQDEDPLDLMLLFDVSGSMLPAVRRLAISAHTALSELHKGDRVAVADFNTGAQLLTPFSDNLEEVTQKVGDIVDVPFGGGTYILKAVQSAAQYFARNADEHRRHAILIFTDNDGQCSAREKTVVDRLWQSDILLCGLIVPTAPMVRSNFPTLGSCENMSGAAEKTGGETVNANDPGHTFREMVRRMRKRYSLFYDTPAAKAGAERKVVVELSDAAKARFPNGTVLARKGYLIPKK
ncbi:MAG TPA: VWA domain-containing protein [Candidatus Sulfopaludibacter sp.]|nr:VWA domain-containing protein [Candidatus Sulfopaludibacter sp.]